MCSGYDFINENTAFLLTLFGLFGAGLSGLAMCLLKSRCTTITCCCLKCDRSVLSEQAVTELSAETV
mgnify:CR=1 FL=1